MKKGIAMISNFSIPVNSLSATDSIGTWVMVNKKFSTVRPSEMEIGMPVSVTGSLQGTAQAFQASLKGLGLLLLLAARAGSGELQGIRRLDAGHRAQLRRVAELPARDVDEGEAATARQQGFVVGGERVIA